MVHRLLVFVAALAVVLAGVVGAPMEARTQEATPSAGVATPMDLPALVLTLDDLAAAGFPGYGAGVSALWSGAEAIAEGYLGDTSAEDGQPRLAAQLAAANVARSYSTWLSQTDPASGEIVRDVLLTVDEYADAAGAEAGFAAIQATTPAFASAVDVTAGAPRVGERSAWVRYGSAAVATPLAATPVPGAESSNASLEVTVRLGALNAAVRIIDYAGRPPAFAEVEALAEALVARIAAVRQRETPDLSFRALRLAGAQSSVDAYVRRDGVTVPNAGETAEERRARDTLFGDATDVYLVSQFVAAGSDGGGDDVLVQDLVARFADDTAAAAYMADLPRLIAENPSNTEITVRPEHPEIGEEALAIAYTRTAPEGDPYRVERVTARVGSEVTALAIRTVGSEPSLDAANRLAAAAVDCLRGEGWCAEVAVPATLTPLMIPSAVAAPPGVEGVVIRQFVDDDAGDRGLALLVFTVLTIDDEALATGDLPGINPFVGQVRTEQLRAFHDFAPQGPLGMDAVDVEGIGDWSQGEFADAAGDGLDVGIVTFGRGPRLQAVLGAGHGDDVLAQITAIAEEWSALGEGVTATPAAATSDTAGLPRTDGLWALLPVPGHLETVPDSFVFDGEWVYATGPGVPE